MDKIQAPTYDYSFVKKINEAIYEDFNDLIEACLGNIQASIFSISNSLFPAETMIGPSK